METGDECPGLRGFIEHWHGELGDWLSGRCARVESPRAFLEGSALAASIAEDFVFSPASGGADLSRDELLERLSAAHASASADLVIEIRELRSFPHGAIIPGSSLIVAAFVEDHKHGATLQSSRRCRCVLSPVDGSDGPRYKWRRVEESWLQAP